MRPLDPRLLRYATAARWYLAVTVALGLAGTGLILGQAGLLAHALASAATGTGLPALSGTLIALLVVLAARAATSYGGEVAALRARGEREVAAAPAAHRARAAAGPVLAGRPAGRGDHHAGHPRAGRA